MRLVNKIVDLFLRHRDYRQRTNWSRIQLAKMVSHSVGNAAVRAAALGAGAERDGPGCRQSGSVAQLRRLLRRRRAWPRGFRGTSARRTKKRRGFMF